MDQGSCLRWRSRQQEVCDRAGIRIRQHRTMSAGKVIESHMIFVSVLKAFETADADRLHSKPIQSIATDADRPILRPHIATHKGGLLSLANDPVPLENSRQYTGRDIYPTTGKARDPPECLTQDVRTVAMAGKIEFHPWIPGKVLRYLINKPPHVLIPISFIEKTARREVTVVGDDHLRFRTELIQLASNFIETFPRVPNSMQQKKYLVWSILD